MDTIPLPYTDEEPIEWSVAQQLDRDQAVWLPTTLCRCSPTSDPDRQYGAVKSEGCAAHVSRDEAILSGLLELLEHDACAIWWYNRLRCPGVDLSCFDDSDLIDLLQEIKDYGWHVELLNLSLDLGVYVIAAVSWNSPGFSRPRLGLGTKFNVHDAVTKAVGELASQIFAAPKRDAPYLNDASLPNHVLPSDAVAGRQYRINHGSLSSLIENLRDKNLYGAVLDQSPDDHGKRYAIRVVVPGLRSLAAHFGPGRLYDVPREHFGITPATEKDMFEMRTISQTFFPDGF